MDSSHVLPPLDGIILRHDVLPDAELADILEHDVAALDVRIAGLDGAVASATEAVLVQVSLIAVRALPEDVAWPKVQQWAQMLLNLREIFEEVNRTI